MENMKLEWDSFHGPLNGDECCWECGVIVNFDTLEARAKDLRIVDLYSEKIPNITYEEEFIVVKVCELTGRPAHMTKHAITLVALKDGILDDSRTLTINWPSRVTSTARYLRKSESITVKFPKIDSEIVRTPTL